MVDPRIPEAVRQMAGNGVNGIATRVTHQYSKRQNSTPSSGRLIALLCSWQLLQNFWLLLTNSARASMPAFVPKSVASS